MSYCTVIETLTTDCKCLADVLAELEVARV